MTSWPPAGIKWYYADGMATLYQGDCREIMASLPAESVHCVVTSPPYWGLRRYAGLPDSDWPGEWHGQYGNEPTVQQYVANTMDVLRAIWRVLRPDGVVWWNIGDSYSNDGKWGGASGNKNATSAAGNYPREKRVTGLKPKDLCLVPERVAVAAQEAGWYVRSRIAWVKPNPMPESVRDRPTDSWEHLWMLTKSPRYFFDAEAVKERATEPDRVRSDKVNGKRPTQHSEGGMFFGAATRNLRSHWEIATQPYSGAHFATFPEELPRRCIMASTSERGVCPICGAPWERIIEKGLVAHTGATESAYATGTTANRLALLRQAARANGGEYVNEVKTLGWRPTCKCGREDTVPATVLDPFGGSGTTGAVAKRLGRHAALVEASAQYCELARERVGAVTLPLSVAVLPLEVEQPRITTERLL